MKGARIPYSVAELAFIEARQTQRRAEIRAAFAQEFGRTDVTADHIKSLCTRKGWTDRERWTAADDAALRAIYPDTSTEDVARRLGRTIGATYARAKALRICKSEAYLASPASGRTDGVRGMGTRFAVGHVSANKGLRRPGWSAGRMRETQFKKGQPARNKKPVGSTRIIDGYHWTKVSDHPRVQWTANWTQTHVLRWESVNGAMPDGTALKCLDGNRLNVEPSNWELIDRGMLPRLNGIYGRGFDEAPAELKPVIMAAAKLEHALKSRRKSA